MSNRKKILIIGFVFLCISLERYGILIPGLGGGGVKAYHILYLCFLVAIIPAVSRVRFRSLEMSAAFLYVLSISVSLLFASNFVKSVVWIFHISVILFGPLFLGFSIRPTLRQMFIGICYGCLPSALMGVVQSLYYFFYPLEWQHSFYGSLPRVYATAYEPGNYAFMLFFGSIPFLLSVFRPPFQKKEFSNLVKFISLFNLIMIFLSTGRSGWICVFSFIFFYFVFYLSARTALKIVQMICIITPLFYFNASFNKLILDYFQRNLKYNDRIIGMKAGLDVFVENPFVGVGPGGFGKEISQNHPDYWKQILATVNADSFKSSNLEWDLTPYNALVEHLVNFGVIGLLWITLGWYCVLASCKRESRSLVFIVSISGLTGVLVNQNLFRPALTFIPMMMWGAAISQRGRRPTLQALIEKDQKLESRVE